MNSNTSYIKVYATSPWYQFHEDDLPCRVVMWKPDDAQARHGIQAEGSYATHLESLDEDYRLSFFWGHYDMNYQEAIQDFSARVTKLSDDKRPNLAINIDLESDKGKK